MEVVLVLTVGVLCISCFIIGAKVGQTVSKGEEVKMPAFFNPIEAYREHENKKHAREEQDILDTIMRNIECFDGTGRGQEDVPGR
jgi:hypothetical protein